MIFVFVEETVVCPSLLSPVTIMIRQHPSHPCVAQSSLLSDVVFMCPGQKSRTTFANTKLSNPTQANRAMEFLQSIFSATIVLCYHCLISGAPPRLPHSSYDDKDKISVELRTDSSVNTLMVRYSEDIVLKATACHATVTATFHSSSI